MKIRINTGRTVVQGSYVDHKTAPEYARETATLRLNPVDMMMMGIDDGERVKATAAGVSVVLRVIADETMLQGTGFVPLGPYANALVEGITHGTGMPDFKSALIDIEPTVEKVLSIGELMRQIGGVAYER